MATVQIAPTQQDVTGRVRQFYEELPFNRYARPADAAALIRKGSAIRSTYPGLDALLRQPTNRRVLEIGCGTGWFANTAALHYGATVHSIDLCAATIAAARGVTEALGTGARVSYQQCDLFTLPEAVLETASPFPVVNTLGVLHHTHDCHAALLKVLGCVAERGFVHVGLYHRYGRKPFLDLFRNKTEDEGLAIYRGLCHPAMTDETLIRSWFRDQALHPHETQHTAAEVYGWLDAAGFDCIATSLNRYQPVEDWSRVFDEETQLEALSHRRNVVEHQYYPGFFTLLARRRGGHS
jgi:2-polyprenyl-3-methyl-5-hydroxy-6-metoxy-1,4-benzoquinol methylase